MLDIKRAITYTYWIELVWCCHNIHNTDEKLLEMVRHRKDGSKSCSTCPTRNHEGYGILDYHYFMGDKKPVYMSTEQIKD